MKEKLTRSVEMYINNEIRNRASQAFQIIKHSGVIGCNDEILRKLLRAVLQRFTKLLNDQKSDFDSIRGMTRIAKILEEPEFVELERNKLAPRMSRIAELLREPNWAELERDRNLAARKSEQSSAALSREESELPEGGEAGTLVTNEQVKNRTLLIARYISGG
jgi:hypothetical protein